MYYIKLEEIKYPKFTELRMRLEQKTKDISTAAIDDQNLKLINHYAASDFPVVFMIRKLDDDNLCSRYLVEWIRRKDIVNLVIQDELGKDLIRELLQPKIHFFDSIEAFENSLESNL